MRNRRKVVKRKMRRMSDVCWAEFIRPCQRDCSRELEPKLHKAIAHIYMAAEVKVFFFFFVLYFIHQHGWHIDLHCCACYKQADVVVWNSFLFFFFMAFMKVDKLTPAENDESTPFPSKRSWSPSQSSVCLLALLVFQTVRIWPLCYTQLHPLHYTALKISQAVSKKLTFYPKVFVTK